MPANPALDQAPAQPMATISEADLDKVSGGGGAGVIGLQQQARSPESTPTASPAVSPTCSVHLEAQGPHFGSQLGCSG